MPTQKKGRVLRRRSWPIMSWSAITFLWILYFLTLLAALAHENHRDALLIGATIAALTTLVRRIGSCRMVLLPDSILVENPICSYQLPHESIHDVRMTSGGGLAIETRQGTSVQAFGFGGSVVDAYFKTTERAVAEAQQMLSVAHEDRGKAEQQLNNTFRRCWSADIPLLLAATLAVAGLLTPR
ncbi:hypothetical protein [Streptomyces sp. TP-A0874]|uniref:hypothetical protein n=1 Tax=Streptomyces sp. TP-A0874 TaxID=549819 RepID=UPI001112DCEE|nr:hypothetical protein [Streptomyces sp. TP-A0874]